MSFRTFFTIFAVFCFLGVSGLVFAGTENVPYGKKGQSVDAFPNDSQVDVYVVCKGAGSSDYGGWDLDPNKPIKGSCGGVTGSAAHVVLTPNPCTTSDSPEKKDYCVSGTGILGATGDAMFRVQPGAVSFFARPSWKLESESVVHIARHQTFGGESDPYPDNDFMMASSDGDYKQFIMGGAPDFFEIQDACHPVKVSFCNPGPECGDAVSASYSSSADILDADKCKAGTATLVSLDNGTFNWTCEGDVGSIPASCSAPFAPPACGSAEAGSYLSAADIPDDAKCDVGTASAVFGSGPFFWTCEGGGEPAASCSAPLKQPPACGVAAVNSYTSAAEIVDADKCAFGLASAVTGSGPFEWSCSNADNSVSEDCSADLATTFGVCGSSDGGSYETPPTELCAQGTPGPVTEYVFGANPPTWKWVCYGAAGGGNASCDAYKPTPGVCGSATNGTYSSAPPSSQLCSLGTPTLLFDAGTRWTWWCQMGPKAVRCSAFKPPVNGECGTADGVSYLTPYNTPGDHGTYCASGVESGVSDDENGTSWSCNGTLGGSSEACFAPSYTLSPVHAKCGSAHGQGFEEEPTENLCEFGTVGNMKQLGSGEYSWTCLGKYGGVNQNCKTVVPVHGECGAYDGGLYSSKPSLPSTSTSWCKVGKRSSVSTTAFGWSWTCAGQNGGQEDECKIINSTKAVCGPADGGIYSSQPPQADACAAGTVEVLPSFGGEWRWRCKATSGSAQASCAATISLDGHCGPAQGVPTETPPSQYLCSAGTPSSVTLDGSSNQFVWSCDVTGAGTDAQCSAPVKYAEPACGSGDGKSFSSSKPPSSTQLCSVGNASGLTKVNGKYQWSCVGQSGTKDALCSAIESNSCRGRDAADFVFIQDLTGSFEDDIANIQAQIKALIYDNEFSNSRMALVTYTDIPESGCSQPGLFYNYKKVLGFTDITPANAAMIEQTFNNLEALDGNADYYTNCDPHVEEAGFAAIDQGNDELYDPAVHEGENARPLVFILSTDAMSVLKYMPYGGGWVGPFSRNGVMRPHSSYISAKLNGLRLVGGQWKPLAKPTKLLVLAGNPLKGGKNFWGGAPAGYTQSDVVNFYQDFIDGKMKDSFNNGFSFTSGIPLATTNGLPNGAVTLLSDNSSTVLDDIKGGLEEIGCD